MIKPLNRISVLDMTEGVAGPCAASMLGDMGASVIKIERPEGDWGRVSGEALGPYFVANNRNKRDVCLDLRKKGAVTLIRRLVERADVVLSNYRKGVMERLGLGYEVCRRIRTDVIYCTISAFGQKGAYSNFPGSDTGLQGISGMMESIGEVGGPPLRVSFPLIDIFSASMAVQGILLALLARQSGKGGTRIDVSLMNAALSLQAMLLASFLMKGELPKRHGNQNPVLSPAGAYETSDGHYITIAILGESSWERFCVGLGIPQLVSEERFKSNAERLKNRDALNAILVPIFRGESRDEWFRKLREADILCSPVNTFADVLSDEKLMESVHLWQLNREGQMLSAVGNPIEIDGAYLSVDRPPPLKGEHTMEVLRELGYVESEIARMLAEGIAYESHL